MKFKSKLEAYSYAVLLLDTIYEEGGYERDFFNKGINQIKAAIENHEQNPMVVVTILKNSCQQLHYADQGKINQLIKDIVNSDYTQPLEEKFKNPLARRLESQLAIELLQAPTAAMMHAVGLLSDKILKFIEDIGEQEFNNGLHFFAEETPDDGKFGSFKQKPTAEAVKKILSDNDPRKLVEIMSIHFKFSRSFTRRLPIKSAPADKPVGKLAEIIKKIWPDKSPETFFSEALAREETTFRTEIPNVYLYKSPLFTAEDNRGRGMLKPWQAHRMGLMLSEQVDHGADFPTHDSLWSPDCNGREANLNSAYVLDLIENDAIYISGPSGMVTMFLGQMEMLANFPSENLKKNYLTAVMSYIVGGGFHSIHEVLAPAQYGLNLVPGYYVKVPEKGKLAPAPNYNLFFTQQETIDPEFAGRRETAWKKYLHYFKRSYVPLLVCKMPSEALKLVKNGLFTKSDSSGIETCVDQNQIFSKMG